MNEKLKNYLGWAIIVSLLSLAGAAWHYVNVYDRSIEPSSFRSFTASGEGKVVLVPDIAQFSFSVLTEGGADIAKLQTENSEKINRAIKFLKEQDLADKDIKTESYNLSPRYQNVSCGFPVPGGPRVCPPPSIVGYTISQTVSVKIRKDNFDKIGRLLAGVIEQGANTVSELNFSIDDPAAAENEARAEAILQAKEKAEAVARAAGFSLGQLLAIEEGIVAPYRKSVFAESGLAAGAAPLPPPDIEPGVQEIRVNLSLRYEIK